MCFQAPEREYFRIGAVRGCASSHPEPDRPRRGLRKSDLLPIPDRLPVPGFVGRVATRPTQRGPEHPPQRLPPIFVEPFQPQLDGPCILPEPEGAEDHVPPGQDRSIVGIGFRLPAAVMDPVHGRGDDDGQEPVVHPPRDAKVGMVEEDHRKKEGFVDGQMPERHPQEGEDCQASHGREDHFPRVEPEACGDVHGRVTVMHPVEPPEERDPVVRTMPEIHPEVEEEDGQPESQPPGGVQDPEQPHAPILGPDLHRHEDRAEENGHEKGIPRPQRQVPGVMADPLTHPLGELGIEREEPLPRPEEDQEDPGYDGLRFDLHFASRILSPGSRLRRGSLALPTVAPLDFFNGLLTPPKAPDWTLRPWVPRLPPQRGRCPRKEGAVAEDAAQRWTGEIPVEGELMELKMLEGACLKSRELLPSPWREGRAREPIAGPPGAWAAGSVATARARFSGYTAFLALLLAGAPAVWAQDGPDPEAADLIRLTATPATVVVAVGETVPFEVLAFDMDGNPVEPQLRFSAPRTGLHVRDGEVLGRQVGEYRIHVSVVTPDGARSVPASIYVENPPPGMPRGPAPVLEIPVRVVWPPVTRVEVGAAHPSLVQGTRVLHRALGFHEDGTSRDDVTAEWRSSDPEVASVDRHGFVTAHGTGPVTITAQVEESTGSLTYEVAPFPARSLELEGGAEVARAGDVLRYRVRALDAEGAPVQDLPTEWSYAFHPHDTVQARGSAGEIRDGVFVAEVPGVYTVMAHAGPLVARSTVEIHPRQVLHRVHPVGRGEVTHTMTHDFWVFEGLDGRDYAITGTTGGTAYIWDVTDPSAIVKTDSIQVDARQVNDVKVSPDSRYAVLTREGASTRVNGVIILDLANPRHPRIAAEFTEELRGGVHNAWPENDYLYALSGGERYVIIDMAELDRPRVVGSYNHPNSSIHDVIVHDGLAYSSEWENGVVVVDVGHGGWGGSPSNPVLVSQIHFPEMLTHTLWPYRQESTGRFYLFASDELWPRVGTPLEGYTDLLPFDPDTGEGGRPAHTGGYVHIIDYTDPENPEKVARYQMDEYGTHNPWVEDDILYQGYYEGGLRVVDVSGELRGDLRAQGREMVAFKPFDPQGYIRNAPMVWGAMPFKGHVFFADANSGLWAVRIEPRGGRPVF